MMIIGKNILKQLFAGYYRFPRCFLYCDIYITAKSDTRSHRTVYAMDKVYLRNIVGSQDLHISFRYVSDSLLINREFNFRRNLNEEVVNGLTRIRHNIEKELQKCTKKNAKKNFTQTLKPLNETKEISVEFLSCADGNWCNLVDITFADMLKRYKCSDLYMHVIDRKFKVVINEPWILNLTLPTCILAGFTVYPSKIELQFAELRYSIGKWYRAVKPAVGDIKENTKWDHCGDGIFFKTSSDDAGYFLKFVLAPGNGENLFGPIVECITKTAIEAGPKDCPFEKRHCFTMNRLSGSSFRIVSYNILADLYADSEYSRTQLFPYCPPYALKLDYRKQLILKEIIGYNADIMCLQEVDMKVFNSDFKIILEASEIGYIGSIAQKGNCGEGIATFYRADRFDLLAQYELNIGENIRTLDVFSKLWAKICNNEQLIDRICDRSTTLQLTLIKCKQSERLLLVANTHLYFHPDADHIRLLQMGFAMLYVEHIYKQTLSEFQHNDEQHLAIIFCGDFNSVPECGIYKLMTERFVREDLIDWKSNENEAIENVSLSQPFNMQSACGTPTYTNYTHSFKACLDYIFYQNDRLQVERVIPGPTEEELSEHIAIPSVVFPSDHVALVADLIFKTI